MKYLKGLFTRAIFGLYVAGVTHDTVNIVREIGSDPDIDGVANTQKPFRQWTRISCQQSLPLFECIKVILGQSGQQIAQENIANLDQASTSVSCRSRDLHNFILI